MIEGVSLDDMLLVDNNPINFIDQWQNGVPIIPFTDKYDDKELPKLLEYFRILYGQRSIVEYNGNYFGIGKMFQANNCFHAYDLIFS
jgi:hypothetical protein